MNIITDRLPEAIRIGDTVYDINSDFRSCLLIIRAFEDNSLTWIEKQYVLLHNLYRQELNQEHVEQALYKGLKFLDRGAENTGGSTADAPKYYSFTKDADLILAAFQQTHGIDLQNISYLHWWHFISLFMDLGADTLFCNLISLRKKIKTNTATKEEKKLAKEMGDLMHVEQIDFRTVAEKEHEQHILEIIKQARMEKNNGSASSN